MGKKLEGKADIKSELLEWEKKTLLKSETSVNSQFKQTESIKTLSKAIT